jgi:putative nucleotidyltransferase with HDIG domain
MAQGPAARRALPFAGAVVREERRRKDSMRGGRNCDVVDDMPPSLTGGRYLAAAPDALDRVLELARSIDARDGGTARHSQVVARYAELTARELSLPPDVVADIRLAGLLHDVGKNAIPERILAKPAPLTDIEWLEMRRHPWIAVELLEDAGLDQIREWIYCHHERPDGSGYPRGLQRDEIPVEARILAVADAYEAMTNDRVYRRSIGRWRACKELRRCAGSQFDEVVVDAFLRVVARDKDVESGLDEREQ